MGLGQVEGIKNLERERERREKETSHPNHSIVLALKLVVPSNRPWAFHLRSPAAQRLRGIARNPVVQARVSYQYHVEGGSVCARLVRTTPPFTYVLHVSAYTYSCEGCSIPCMYGGFDRARRARHTPDTQAQLSTPTHTSTTADQG